MTMNHENNSYEPRVYESVDGGNLSQKSTGGKINAAKVKKICEFL